MALPDPYPSDNSSRSIESVPHTNVSKAAASLADDDLSIEKMCIAKSRSISHQLSFDPFSQAREIAKVKSRTVKKAVW